MNYTQLREKREHGTNAFPCGIYHVDAYHPRYEMIYHWHDECEIIVIKRGSFELSVNGRATLLKEGECSFITGGSIHGGTPRDCEYDCIVFDMEMFLKGDAACYDEIHPCLEHIARPMPFFPAESETARLAREIAALMTNKPEGYRFYVHGKLLCFAGSIIKAGFVSGENENISAGLKKTGKFKKVLTYIEHNYSRQITLEEMAAQSGMNPNYFCRAFKEYTDRTPVEYLNRYRIESACEMIANTDKKLSDIASECGFNDYSYFTRVFKNLKGVQPKDYRHKGRL